MLSLWQTYRSHIQAMPVVLLLALLVCVPLSSCNSPTPPPLFTSLNLGIPGAALNSPVKGPLPDTTELSVGITFKIDPKLLATASAQKIQPGQPSKLEQFANRIGISDSLYQKIKGFFSLSGIALKLSKLHTHLGIRAKASTLAKVLQTKFVIHQYKSRTFFAPATPPKVPTFLASSIDAITGLDNYSARPIHALSMQFNQPRVFHTNGHLAQDCNASPQTLFPSDIAGAYGYTSLLRRGITGQNMTINLVEIDGSYRSDIQNYLSCVGFKGHLSFTNVDYAPSQALGESTLDVQMVAGLAPDANIAVYQTDGNANDDTWAQVNDALQQIIDDNTNNASAGSVVSISLGMDEADMASADITAIDSSLRQLTQIEHMTVFVASGDCAAFADQNYGDLSVSFPASDPWAVAVGGTVLSVTNSQQRANEVVWSDNSNQRQCKNNWGSGGGNSILFNRPGWQNASGVNNRYSQNRRQVPDISAVAYGLAVYFQGQWGDVGGTSAAAPIWAAGQLLVNEDTMQRLHTFGYSPQLFYSVANKGGNAFFDITRGNNLYFPATSGWDYSTGLGTPNLANYDTVVSSMV